jgi:hypothetical protein
MSAAQRAAAWAGQMAGWKVLPMERLLAVSWVAEKAHEWVDAWAAWMAAM